MKKVLKLALAIALLSPLASATISFVQTAINQTCTTTSATCTITSTNGLAATGSGNLLIVTMGIANTSDTISSVSGGGTYSLCTSSGCHGSDASTGKGLDAAFNVNSTSGATTITVTRSSTTTSAWNCRIYEFSSTFGAGAFALDVFGVRDQNTATGTPAGVTLTLTGTNDVILQDIAGNSPTAISGAYSTTFVAVGIYAWGYVVNTNSGTAPTWTQTSNRAVLGGIAFKETGSAAQSGFSKRHKLETLEE